MEFENTFSRPGKVVEFHFLGPNSWCCLRTGNNFSLSLSKLMPQKAAFSAFRSREKFKESLKSTLLPNFGVKHVL